MSNFTTLSTREAEVEIDTKLSTSAKWSYLLNSPRKKTRCFLSRCLFHQVDALNKCNGMMWVCNALGWGVEYLSVRLRIEPESPNGAKHRSKCRECDCRHSETPLYHYRLLSRATRSWVPEKTLHPSILVCPHLGIVKKRLRYQVGLGEGIMQFVCFYVFISII